MIISLDPPFVFIHVPKTAGLSLERALGQYAHAPEGTNPRWFNPFHAMERPDPLDSSIVVHSPARALPDLLDPEFLERAFTFGFVRNPWEWLVSYYSFGKVTGPRETRPEFCKRFPTFKDWVKDALVKESTWLEETYGHYAYRVKIPQHYYLADEEGKILVDFVGRYERLQDDLRRACELAGVPVPTKLTRGHRSAHGPHREYYDEETLGLVAPFVERDAELFGYTFEDEPPQ